MLEIVMATHAGMTTDEFEKIVKDWIATAKHPMTKRLYTEMVYQPMLELLAYLRANGFKTFIVSGGGIEFMRPWTEQVYGIPPEQVVGSSIKTKFELRDGKPVLVRLPEMNFIDDKEGKPVGIHQHIGRRPIAAFGNSDGDLQMLQWTAAGSGPRSACSSTTPTPSANGPTTASPPSAGSTRTRRSPGERLDGGRHEEGLEDHLPIREEVRRKATPGTPTLSQAKLYACSFSLSFASTISAARSHLSIPTTTSGKAASDWAIPRMMMPW